MHGKDSDQRNHNKYLEKARALYPLIAGMAQASEEAGSLARPVFDAMADAGFYWMLLPRELGGGATDMVSVLEVWEEISRADASAGWCLMAYTSATSLAGAFCGDDAVKAMFGNGKRPVMAGMSGPGGSAVAVDGGYRGSGKFKFGSGCAHAGWIIGGFLVTENGAPRRLPNGDPEARLCFFPRDHVKFAGNWDVLGLRGTGSIDYEVIDQFVPPGFSFERASTTALRGGPIFGLGLSGIGSAGHATTALGLMRRALEEIARLAFVRKRPAYQTVLGEDPIFRRDFANHEAAYRAARAFTYQVYEDAQNTVFRGEELSAAQRQRFRQSMIYVNQTAINVVRFCYMASGSDGLRNPSPLGRCMRDVSGSTQHALVETALLVDIISPILDQWRGMSAES